MRRISIIALAILIADLVTKAIVAHTLAPYGSVVHVAGDVVRLIHVRNTGSAFSFFQGQRAFFIVFSIVSILLIAALARSPRNRRPPFGVALGMILGGALGNLVDRIAYGAVTDWIDVGIGPHRWPTFNVADIGITLGVLLLAFLMFMRPEEIPPAPDGDRT